MSISTHVLDAVNGVPAQGMELSIETLEAEAAGPLVDTAGTPIGTGVTDADGRCPELTAGLALEARAYRLRFETGAWFARTSTPTFYPVVDLIFEVSDPTAHYHVPLLLSPFAYSTYRGS
jgi:5-hydroxyisourate hydrolase